jgi:hypothetical protein
LVSAISLQCSISRGRAVQCSAVQCSAVQCSVSEAAQNLNPSGLMEAPAKI